MEKKKPKRTKSNVDMETLRAISNRVALAKLVSGQSFDGDRDLYKQLGYADKITFDDYMGRYLRQDIAKAIIDRPTKKTWSGKIGVSDPSDAEETALEKAWDALYDDFALSSIFTRVDKLTGLGKYGVLLLGLSDVKKQSDWQNPVIGTKKKLLYLKPLSEKTAKIHQLENDPSNKRFGLPKFYKITLNDEQLDTAVNTTPTDILVHYTRVLHIVDELLESEVEGLPRLEVVFNRLFDIEKLAGGDAEMFWKGARPGYSGKTEKDYTLTPDQKDALYENIEEYEHGLTRFLFAQGIDIKELAQQIADPSNHLDVQIQLISAVTNIPKRILTGSERGELSSSQDSDEWNNFIVDRREDYAEPRILRPFINLMMQYDVLPKATKGKYAIEWEDLFTSSDKEKAEIGKTRAQALKEYATNPNASNIVLPQSFLKLFLGLTEAEIEIVLQELEEAQISEGVSEEETNLLNEEQDEEQA